MKPKVGAPLTYDHSQYAKIIQAVHDVLVLGQVAGLIGVPRITFHDWLAAGDDDRKNNICSELAQLSTGVRLAQAQEVVKLLESIRKNKKGAGNAKWLLEKCFAEDFGRDAEAYKVLLEKYQKVVDYLMRRNESPIQGFVNG